MSKFKSFKKVQKKSVVKFFLNISKKESKKETILGYTHNGVIFASNKNDSSWLQFRAISSKQGMTPIEVEHQGQIIPIDAAKFWCNLFSADDISELPDIKLKANIGDIEAGEDIVSQGGCLVIEADPTAFSITEGEYKGSTIIYVNLKVEEMYLQPISSGEAIDSDWLFNSLSNAVKGKSNSQEMLSKYRKTKKVAPVQEMAVDSVQEKKDEFDFDTLIDM